MRRKRTREGLERLEYVKSRGRPEGPEGRERQSNWSSEMMWSQLKIFNLSPISPSLMLFLINPSTTSSTYSQHQNQKNQKKNQENNHKRKKKEKKTNGVHCTSSQNDTVGFFQDVLEVSLRIQQQVFDERVFQSLWFSLSFFNFLFLDRVFHLKKKRKRKTNHQKEEDG